MPHNRPATQRKVCVLLLTSRFFKAHGGKGAHLRNLTKKYSLATSSCPKPLCSYFSGGSRQNSERIADAKYSVDKCGQRGDARNNREYMKYAVCPSVFPCPRTIDEIR